jgi:prolyl oligopeptidase
VRFPLYGGGTQWTEECGSPDNPDELRVLLSYSPYHHVSPARYPAVLIQAAADDDLVSPMHAKKLAAALQWSRQVDLCFMPFNRMRATGAQTAFPT